MGVTIDGVRDQSGHMLKKLMVIGFRFIEIASKSDTWYYLISPKKIHILAPFVRGLASSTVKLSNNKLKIIFWYYLTYFVITLIICVIDGCY